MNYVATSTKPFRISGPDDVANFVRSILTDNSREHFVALYLDGSHRVASHSIVSIGSASQTSFTTHYLELRLAARLLFKIAFKVAIDIIRMVLVLDKRTIYEYLGDSNWPELPNHDAKIRNQLGSPLGTTS